MPFSGGKIIASNGRYHKKVCDVHGYNIMKKRILSIILTILIIFGTDILPASLFETM